MCVAIRPISVVVQQGNQFPLKQEEIRSPHNERLSNQTVDSPRDVGPWDVELPARGVLQSHPCSWWGKPHGDRWVYSAYCMVWHGWSVVADLDGYVDLEAGIGMLSHCYCIEQHSQITHLYTSIPLVVALVQSYYPTESYQCKYHMCQQNKSITKYISDF